MHYGTEVAKGQIQINATPVFLDEIAGKNPLTIDYSTFLEGCEQRVKSEFTPKGGALNNVRGRWYEWLLGLGYHYYLRDNPNSRNPDLFLPVPNISSLDVYDLYVPEVAQYIADLKAKTQESGISFITSNPDFVIIRKLQSPFIPIDTISEETIYAVDNMYMSYLNVCKFDEIVGFGSVKTSLRPDRRIQIAHEGNLRKTFYEHLKTRLWITDAPGLKYFACTQNFTVNDAAALQSVATHSVLSVNSMPVPSVDALFGVANGTQLIEFFNSTL